MTNPFQEDWQDIRVQPPVEQPRHEDLALVAKYLADGPKAGVILYGDNPQERGGFYKSLAEYLPDTHLDGSDPRAWIWSDPLNEWTAQLSRLRPQGRPALVSHWGWLKALASVEALCIEEPLRSMTDRTGHLLNVAMQVFLDLRFTLREEPDKADQVLSGLVGWASGQPVSFDSLRVIPQMQPYYLSIVWPVLGRTDRINVLMFLLVLAAQNGVVGKTAFLFDDLEEAISRKSRENLVCLYELIAAVNRWAHTMSAPVRLFVGINPKKFKLLGRVNPKLFRELSDMPAY